MKYGISTACFYPENTEKVIKRLAINEVSPIEIFFNTFCEFDKSYIKEFKSMLSGIDVSSVHPFTSGFETMMFFSNYDRRFNDGLEIYKKVFSVCNDLDAPYMIFHGVKNEFPVDPRLTYERFGLLAMEARKMGVTILHENVSRCKGKSPDYILGMRKEIGSLAKFVLDTKQCLRSDIDVLKMVDAMGEDLKHVHISDNCSTKDCLPPGKGEFDFKAFSSKLKSYGFDGSVIIELYKNNYNSFDELFSSLKTLKKLMD